MKNITITADMIDEDLFDKFEADEIGNDYTNMDVANSKSYNIQLEVDGENVEVTIRVFTKYCNDQDAYELIEEGHDDANYIYKQISWISEKWEVVPGFGETDLSIAVNEEAIGKLDKIHDRWEESTLEYVVNRIEKLMSAYN